MQATRFSLSNQPLIAVLAAVILQWSSTLHAQSSWDGGGSDASWRTAANWAGDILPTYGSTADINFPSSANLSSGINTFLGAGSATQIQNLSFGADVDSALGITLSTAVDNLVDARLTFQNTTLNTITVDAGASGNITIGNPINDTTSLPTSPGSSVQTLGNLAINHSGTGTLLINRPISSSNAFSITKTGTGTWQQSGTVFLTGALNVNQGTILDNTYTTNSAFNPASAINLGGGNFTIINTGPFNRQINNNINVTSNSTIGYANQDASNRRMIISSSNTTTISAGQTLTLRTISTNTALANIIDNQRIVSGAGSLAVEGFNNINAESTNFANGRVAFNASLSGLSGDLEVRKGTAELYGTNIFTNLNTGRFIIGETGNSFGAGLLISPSNNVNITNSISVRSGGFRSIRGANDFNIAMSGGIEMLGDLNVDASVGWSGRSLSLNGPLSGNGDLTVTRAGSTNAVLALGGDNSGWNGDLIVASGIARFGGNGTNVAGNGSIYIGVTGNTNSAILSSYYVVPTIVLNSTNTVTNNITVRSGGPRSLQFVGDARYNFTGNIELEQTLNVNSGLNYFTDKWIVLAGNISGNGGLDITRSSLGGYIELSGNNTYAGITTISNGATLRVNSTSGNGIPNASAVSMNGPSVTSGSSVFTNSLRILTSETIGSLSASSADASLVIGDAATLTTGGDNSSTTYAGSSSGLGGLTKEGSGTMTLSGDNAYTGLTTVSDGTLVVSTVSLSATISSNSVAVAFTSVPSTGTTYTVLPGALATNSLGTTPVVTGLGTGQSATVTNDPNLVVKVTSNVPAGPTFESAYPAGTTMTDVAPNGLTYLMNYAFGGSSIRSATLPSQDTSDPTKLTLVAYVRTDNAVGTLSVVGEKGDTLSNFDTDNPILGEVANDQSTAPAGTQKRIFSVPANGDRLFLRLKAKLTP